MSEDSQSSPRLVREEMTFDRFIDALAGVDGRLMITDSDQTPWTMESVELDDLVVQRAQEGGPNTYEGEATPDRIGLHLRLPSQGEVGAYGKPWSETTVIVTRPGQSLTSYSDGRLRFTGISLPVDRMISAIEAFDPERGEALLRNNNTFEITPDSAQRIAALVEDVMVAGARPESFTGESSRRSARDALVEAYLSGIAGHTPQPTGAGRPQISRHLAVAALRDYLNIPEFCPRNVTEMALHVGLPRRTLRKLVHECFGVSPHQLILLTQIHEIRADLVSDRSGANVTDIAGRHGVWELGRFAGRYRAIFGETPSESLARSRFAGA